MVTPPVGGQCTANQIVNKHYHQAARGGRGAGVACFLEMLQSPLKTAIKRNFRVPYEWVDATSQAYFLIIVDTLRKKF